MCSEYSTAKPMATIRLTTMIELKVRPHICIKASKKNSVSKTHAETSKVSLKLIVTTSKTITEKAEARARLATVSLLNTLYCSKSKYSGEYENVPLTPNVVYRYSMSFRN